MKAAKIALAVTMGCSGLSSRGLLQPTSDDIRERVNRSLSWFGYWHAVELAPLDLRVRVKAVRFTDRWVLFIADRRLKIETTVKSDGRVGPLVSVDQSPLYGGSNTAALELYERSFPRSDPDCVPVRILAQQPTTPTVQGHRLPASRPCVEAPRRVSELELLITVTPELAATVRLARDRSSIIAVVRRWVRRYYPGLSGRAQIPNYSTEDPAVYVFMYSLDGQVRGILVVQRELSGGMVAGKFLEQPESIRHYVDRIQKAQPVEVDWSRAQE